MQFHFSHLWEIKWWRYLPLSKTWYWQGFFPRFAWNYFCESGPVTLTVRPHHQLTCCQATTAQSDHLTKNQSGRTLQFPRKFHVDMKMLCKLESDGNNQSYKNWFICKSYMDELIRNFKAVLRFLSSSFTCFENYFRINNVFWHINVATNNVCFMMYFFIYTIFVI